MVILGIHPGHNASACLLHDGRLVAALQEERPARVKNHTGFPRRAVREVLEQAGLALEDIDLCATLGIYRLTPEMFQSRESVAAHFRRPPSPLSPVQLRDRAERLAPVGTMARALRRRLRDAEAEREGIPRARIRRVDHHTAHAASAYHGWGRYDEPVLVLTCDGQGDGLCATVSVGREGRLERLAAIGERSSVGLVYSMTTLLLGMTPNEHEYKVMGLAPYAQDGQGERLAKVFAACLAPDPENPLGWTTGPGIGDTYWCYQRLRRDLEFERFDAIAAGLQLWLERFLTDWVRRCVARTGIRRLALSGGVFMNVKANQRIMEMEEVEEIFVFPSCGDETNAIGAAYLLHAQHRGVEGLEPLRSLYLGPDPGEEEIDAALRRCPHRLQVRRPPDLGREVAGLLAAGEVVARFAGREEFGARALGNRSILADPSQAGVVRVINDMIKSRDFWMPFACSILAERADDYLVNPKGVPAPFMIMTFDTTARRREIRAGLHPYDGTARPQVVRREDNPGYHRIISEFAALTGIGAVLNTSFNVHGEPIVHTADDALEVLATTGLRHLALGPYLVTSA